MLFDVGRRQTFLLARLLDYRGVEFLQWRSFFLQSRIDVMQFNQHNSSEAIQTTNEQQRGHSKMTLNDLFEYSFKATPAGR
jgi:hypothetical protein